MQGLKRFLLILTVLALVLSFVSCTTDDTDEQEGVVVVATLFPQYDFAKAILGEKGSAVLLLTPGADSHNFELTPTNIRTINKCDLFVYTGPDMEIWVDSIIDSVNKDVKIVSLSTELKLDTDHDHPYADHEHENDPHIWTNPKNALQMLTVICNYICDIDPDNKDYYKSNFDSYAAKLSALDDDIQNIASAAKGACLYFSGKFAFEHFVEEYGFTYVAPFNSCSDVQIESLAAVRKLIEDLKTNDVKYIFYEELSNNSILDTIVSETGVTPLLLHSAHNVSKEDFDNGETYISLMQSNVNNLRKALK